MKYCTSCGAEYRDEATRCADCDHGELSSTPLHQASVTRIPVTTERYVRAGTAEEPLMAERYEALLQQSGIPVLKRGDDTGAMSSATRGTHGWWELLVPETHLARAVKLLEEERERLEASAEDNARAAEEEAGG